VYGIVTQSGGTIEVVSDVGKGSEFSVYLPRIPGESEPIADATVSTNSPRGSETVLLVEDEDSVRSLTRQVLRGQGYVVLDVRQTAKALEICDKYTRPIHLLLTDLVMPGMNGRELAERLLPVRPDMKVLYMSGYENGVLGQQGKLPAGVAFLHKPFTPDSLARKVREVLDQQPT
jgi:CheY-like chemotaxis protein